MGLGLVLGWDWGWWVWRRVKERGLSWSERDGFGVSGGDLVEELQMKEGEEVEGGGGGEKRKGKVMEVAIDGVLSERFWGLERGRRRNILSGVLWIDSVKF